MFLHFHRVECSTSSFCKPIRRDDIISVTDSSPKIPPQASHENFIEGKKSIEMSFFSVVKRKRYRNTLKKAYLFHIQSQYIPFYTYICSPDVHQHKFHHVDRDLTHTRRYLK